MIYPNNPFIGQTIEVGGTRKMWDGQKWKNVTHGNHELRLQFAEKSAAFMTLAEAQASNLKVGQYVRLTDYDNALYKKVSSNVGQSFYIALVTGGFLEYVQIVGTAKPEIHTAKIGVSSTNSASNNSTLLEEMRVLIAASGGEIRGVYSGGEIPTSATTYLLGVKFARFDNFTVKPQFEGTAVAVAPAAGQLVENYEWEGTLRVVWDTVDYTTNRIAFFLQNMYNCRMTLSSHRSYRGIYCNGNATGFVHNDIYISDMFSNWTDVYLTTSTAVGWCNSNRFHGGFFYGAGDFAGLPNESEAAHIYIDESSGYPPNGNRFINPSLEWVGSGKMMANLAGLRNRIEVQYTEVNNTGGGARDGTWYIDRGDNNVWDFVNVPYIIGYEEGGASNRLDITAATAPWVKGVQGYYDLEGLGTQHYKTTGTRPAILCEGDDKILVARNTSSGALPGLEVEGPAGQAGVKIPAAGVWTVFNGSIKIGWNFVAAPTTGLWSRGDIVYNVTPSPGGYVGWICVVGDGTGVGTWSPFGNIGA